MESSDVRQLNGASPCPGCGNMTKPEELILLGLGEFKARYRCGECERTWGDLETKDESHIPNEEYKKIIVSTLHEIDMSNRIIAQSNLDMKRTLTRMEKLLKKVLK